MKCQTCGESYPSQDWFETETVCRKCYRADEAAPTQVIAPELLTVEWAKQIEDKVKVFEGRLPQSNILHPNFWTRAWAVWGHSAMVQVFVSIFLWFFIAILSALP
jgi:hypothetical protein